MTTKKTPTIPHGQLNARIADIMMKRRITEKSSDEARANAVAAAHDVLPGIPDEKITTRISYFLREGHDKIKEAAAKADTRVKPAKTKSRAKAPAEAQAAA